MISYYNKTDRSAVRRRAGRAAYDRETIDAILDEGLVAHLGIVGDGQPYVIPVLYARAGTRIYLHGSPLSRLLGTLVRSVPMCLTVTLLDGIVFARSAFHHSLNYRSVVVLGCGRALTDPDAKREALEVIVGHVARERPGDVRGPDDGELAATEVIALEIEEASAKIRTGPPVDAPADYALPAWAGELPLRLTAAEPIPDPRCAVPVPDYVSSYARADR
jgi:nitroimidazol reductase NimA-like FMN-containing flavoprotein (pyridoxamine 5'-phosphate oxidase superfamily)